jgi:thiol-disulfide isomerase/thioredoxin
MTTVRPAALRVRWWLWLAQGLLIAAPYGSARAQSPVPDLLKPLDLVAYSSRTPPPSFGGGTVDARQVSMIELRGKVVVVNFWATWCLECRQEMPALERLYRELAPQGFVIVAVNVREKKDTAQRYGKELGLTFPLVLDPDGKVSAQYGVIGLPATFLVGRDGRAIAFAIGPREWGGAPARALFNALLAEPAAGGP